MATDAAADTLPSRSDRDGLFDKTAETSSWTPKPLPSHPHDRAKAHNKLVAIMRCLSKGVFSNEAARLESHGRIMQRLHSSEIDGSAARSLRERRRCKRRRKRRCFFGDALSHRVLERPMAVGGLFYSADAALPLLHCASRTINVVIAQNISARAKSISCAACCASVDVYFLHETLSYCKPVN